MDDFMITSGIPGLRRIFDEIIPDGNNNIGLCKRLDDVISALQAHGKQAVLVIHRHRALTHKRVHHRDTGFTGETP